MKKYATWHTRVEKRVIRQNGGVPLQKYGYDGRLNGRPVEVRAVRRDNRYRIQKNVHAQLVRQKGCYIFVDKRGQQKRVSAKDLSKKMGRGNWFKDRQYPHRFVTTKQVFSK